MKQVKGTFNRDNLSEGRTSGLSFAVINDDYKTVTPFSACKDYINDFVYANQYGDEGMDYVYGYKAENIEFFKEKKLVKIIAGVLPKQYIKEPDYSHSSPFSQLLEQRKNEILFLEHYNSINQLLLDFCKTVNIKCDDLGVTRATFIPEEGAYQGKLPLIIMELPVALFKNPYYISLALWFAREFYDSASTLDDIYNIMKSGIINSGVTPRSIEAYYFLNLSKKDKIKLLKSYNPKRYLVDEDDIEDWGDSVNLDMESLHDDGAFNRIQSTVKVSYWYEALEEVKLGKENQKKVLKEMKTKKKQLVAC